LSDAVSAGAKEAAALPQPHDLKIERIASIQSWDDAQLLHRAAHACIQNGELGEALSLLRRAVRMAPHDPQILNSLGNVLRKQGEADEASKAFQRACELDPQYTSARFNLARLLEDLDEIPGARAEYQILVAQAPRDVDALSRLFYLSAIEGDYEAAQAYGQRVMGPSGLEIVCGQLSSIALQRADFSNARRFGELAVGYRRSARAITTLAHAEFRDGDADGAHARITQLLAGKMGAEDRAFALSLLGDIGSALGKSDEAFANYAKSKAILAALYAPQFERPSQRTALALTKDLYAFFSSRNLKRAASRAHEDRAPKAHIFLVGFPRSGSTLLQQSLALHPEIRTLDEVDILMTTSAPLWSTHAGLEAFAAADDASLLKFRNAYWRGVRDRIPDLAGKIFIDKMPLNCLLLPHIAQLFPDAKVLFVTRDPRDVVFSAFRTRFVMTAFMYEFCTLQRTARFYDAVMSLCDLYRQSLPLEIMETRYEDLLADFDSGLRAICGFLGVDFQNAMMNPENRARSHIISTPSGAQIARGRYDGARQWRRYSAHLAPILPVLEPWVRRFSCAN
jgi:Flp pilus assembly protein TadD